MEANIVGSKDYDPIFGVQSSNEIRKNPLDELPFEISLKIFSEFPFTDLGSCGLVSKQWLALSEDQSLWKKIPANAFGAKQWEDFFGIKVDEPPLPLNIHKILKSQCPFSEKGKKIEDTHVLVLIPGRIDEKPLTLKTFGKLVGSRFPEFGKKGYEFIIPGAKEFGGDGKSHWVLMTKDVLSGTRGLSFDSQQKQIKDQGNGNYCVPKTLEATVCVISEYVRTAGKTRLFCRKPPSSDLTYTRCQEEIRGHQVCVGDFFPSVIPIQKDIKSVGVAPLRKF